MRSSSATTAATATAASLSLVKSLVYIPPEWAMKHFTNLPQHGRLHLAHLPTPLYQPTKTTTAASSTSSSPILDLFSSLDITFLVKRDDMSGGVELGGNKVRKLEFLLADALHSKDNNNNKGFTKKEDADEDEPYHYYDSIVTIGGEQSNHCRATACAARMVGLEPHLILRTKRTSNSVYPTKTNSATTATGIPHDGITKEKIDSSTETNHSNNNESSPKSSFFGTVGNVLLDRMVGSKIYTCTPGEYGRLGSEALVQRLCTHLQETHGKHPYAIPVGGSNAIGTWGYIEAIHELEQQMKDIHYTTSNHDDNHDSNKLTIDHVVFACGSGGTAAGVTLGLALCPYLQHPKVHAVGVCDDPNYFHHHITNIAMEMGFVVPNKNNHIHDNDDNDSTPSPSECKQEQQDAVNSNDDDNRTKAMTTTTFQTTLDFVKNSMTVHQGKGLGYALSTPNELDFCIQFARETGIILDPVYSGKALYHFCTHVLNESYRDSTILFWHTGGALGMYDKELDETVESYSPVKRLDVYGKNDKDGMVTI